MYECLIAGTGFTGSVAARMLAEAGVKVLVVEKRDTIAGNMYDEEMDGILVQKYGPHVFHTKNSKIYDFITAYDEWEDYTLRCQVYMDGKFTPSPFNEKTMDTFLGEEEAKKLKAALKEAYPGQDKATIVELLENTDPVISAYANLLFEKDYSLYTAKQWGIPASEVDVSTLKRVPVRFDGKDRYYDEPYECNPKNGYTEFFRKLLDHENITVRLNTDVKDCIEIRDGKVYARSEEGGRAVPVLYTGAIDMFFDYIYGKLPYRSLRFRYETLEQESFQEAPVVAYPQAPDFTRITEYSKLPVQNGNGKTVLAYEYPLSFDPKEDMEPYYPISSGANQQMFERYRKEAEAIEGLFTGGRLADYKYYYMDDAAARGMELAEEILKFMRDDKNEENHGGNTNV